MPGSLSESRGDYRQVSIYASRRSTRGGAFPGVGRTNPLAEAVAILVDFQNCIGDVVHVRLGGQQWSGSPNHRHFCAYAVAVRAEHLVAVLPQAGWRGGFLVRFRRDDSIDPRLLVQALVDIGTEADSLRLNRLEKTRTVQTIEALLSVTHSVKIEGAACCARVKFLGYNSRATLEQ